jgi:tetratricopeptide (TPR) repeat protein
MSNPPASLALGRFKQLPQRMAEVWQGSIRRLPVWVENEDDPAGAPFRPLGAFWVSLRTGLIHIETAAPDTPRADLALSSFLAFGLKWARRLEGRPLRVEVTDPQLCDALAPHLVGLNTAIGVVDALPQLEAAFLEIEAESGGGVRYPGALESPGVTAQRLRAFADAAAEFYRARPWQHLVNEDLIVVESPKPPKGMAVVSVLGNGGQEFGLSFFASRKAFDRLVEGRRGMPTEAHGVTFGPIDELPFADVDAWEAHHLPVAGPRGYPLFCRMGLAEMKRPSATELTFAEALLRAFARVTEDELDAGRWSSRVAMFDGEVTLTLALPTVIDAASAKPQAAKVATSAAGLIGAERIGAAVGQMLDANPGASLDDINAMLAKALEEDPQFRSARTAMESELMPLERAQEIAYDAMESQGRVRIALARRALALSADCADAHVILGDAAPDTDVAQAHYERGVDAGRRAIGQDFDEFIGGFWGHLETRPYMRARTSLAQLLADTGRADEARAQYEDMLRLNPGDNQGLRYLLLPLLLEAGDDAAAAALLEKYPGDVLAMWPYAAALIAFRREGDSSGSQSALTHAIQSNPYVLDYLLAPETLPVDPPPYVTVGGRDDAVSVARALLPAFEETPGAPEWVQVQLRSRKRGVKGGTRRGKGVGRRQLRAKRAEKARGD